MSEKYNNLLDSIGADGGSVRSGGLRVEVFNDDTFFIEGLYDDETGIDKEVLKKELGEELSKKIEEQGEEITKRIEKRFQEKFKNKGSEISKDEIREIVENILNEKSAEKLTDKSETQVSFEERLSELEGLDIEEIDKEYEKEKDKRMINKKIKDKDEESLITEYKSDSGTTVIVNTGVIRNERVSRWRYKLRRIRRAITTGILVVIFLTLVYLYLNPEIAKEVGLMIDTQLVPWIKESVLPILGESMEKTIGKIIDKLLEWSKGL